MRQLVLAVVLALAAGFSASPAAALKKTAYPEVKVEVAAAFVPDDAFTKMRRALAAAVTGRNAEALFALVGPTFVWTLEGGPNAAFDMGRGALDNFKVLFGFRAAGAAVDGNVPDGPYWDVLAGFVADDSAYQVADAGNLVCGPLGADLVNAQVFEQARAKIETDDEPALWYFTVAPTAATAKPEAKAAPVARLGTVAVPVVGIHPPDDAAAATHVEVLLPNGKTGWLEASAVRPLTASRLCYARTADGDWKIAAFDQNDD